MRNARAGCPASRGFRDAGAGAIDPVRGSQTFRRVHPIFLLVPRSLHRYYGAGDLHFITCSCFERQPFLASARYRDLFLTVLEAGRRRYRVVVLGYVVMPGAPGLAGSVSSPTTCFTFCPGTSFTLFLFTLEGRGASAPPRWRAGSVSPVRGSRSGSNTPAPVSRSVPAAPIPPVEPH